MAGDAKIAVTWDIGTAYDMFVSLAVLHDPETFGLRGSWAAGVRSRLPAAEREFLQDTIGLLWPFDWVYGLSEPKDGAAVLAGLAALLPEERIPTLQAQSLEGDDEALAILKAVGERSAWDEDDLRQFSGYLQREKQRRLSTTTVRKMATAELNLWADLAGSGEILLSGLTAFYDAFYAEEEQRIRATLQTALDAAQSQAQTRSLAELLEELSQGVRFDKAMNMRELVLVPSFWATPLMIFSRVHSDKELFLFGARPADMSLIPGDVVPDALYQALKALADPTRLRILRYLTEEPSTPADLARRLRLRAPTVIHHLDALRLARLVQLTLSHEGKRYAIRAEAIDSTFALLNDFLTGEEWDEASAEAATE